MNRIITFIFFLFSMIGLGKVSYASHILGGELTYKYVSSAGTNHTYEVTIILYGDCSGSTFYTFANTSFAGLNVYNNGTISQTAVLLPRVNAESDILVSSVCPIESQNTTCNGGTYPGIKKFTFRGNVVLAGTSTLWRFAFNGNQYTAAGVSTTTAGRSALIQNATNIGTMYVAGTLNNTNGQNNSPTFTSTPSPFYCVNSPASYSLNAVELDGDIMTYELAAPSTNLLGTTTVGYQAGFSATNPLPFAPGTWNFNTTNGNIDFTPNATTNSVIMHRVTETRNGQVVGTAEREIFFVFLQNCANEAPAAPPANVQNGDTLGTQGSTVNFEVCQGQQNNFAFTLNPTDPQGDNITLTASNLPAGATFNVVGNNTAAPVGSFEWNLSVVPAGNYTFFLNFEDDGCPLSSRKTITYNVTVLPQATNFSQITLPPCYYMVNGKAIAIPAANDTGKYNYIWRDVSQNVIRSLNNKYEGDTLSNVAPGIYYLEAINSKGCSQYMTFTVPEPNYNVDFNMDSILCINTPLPIELTDTFGNIQNFAWNFGNGTTATGLAPNHQYSIPGIYEVTLVGTTDLGCKDTAVHQVQVFNTMRPEFYLNKDSICLGQRVEITTAPGQYATNIDWTFGSTGSLSGGVDDSLSYAFNETGSQEIEMNVSYIACPSETFKRIVYVAPYPEVYLGYDTAICYKGTPITLANTKSNAANGGRIISKEWNTGSTDEQINVEAPGTYVYSVTNAPYCVSTDTVVVNKDCYVDIPNAFTPNGDGNSDYFFPRSLITNGVVKFEMTIYNRWGQVVFKTDTPDGRGWDGKFNNIDQPGGVYVYEIMVIMKNLSVERYRGNVTLIR